MILPSGRPVLPKTRSNRERLPHGFSAWLNTRGVSWTNWLEDPNPEAAVIGSGLWPRALRGRQAILALLGDRERGGTFSVDVEGGHHRK